MAIFEITDTEIIQRCAKCSSENRIAVAGLEVGVARDTEADARILPLPACPHCRSTELLVRSPDGEPEYPSPGTFGHLHRMLVDHLHAELVKANRVHSTLRDPDGRPKGDIARPVPSADRERWFPRGMKMELKRGE